MKSALAVAAILAGCGTISLDDPPGGGTGGGLIEPGTDHGSGVLNPPPAACGVSAAPGTVEDTRTYGPGAGLAVLVSNAAGDVAYAAPTDGITRLDADLNVVFAYPYGWVVARDAHGNAYVAGSFT